MAKFEDVPERITGCIITRFVTIAYDGYLTEVTPNPDSSEDVWGEFLLMVSSGKQYRIVSNGAEWHRVMDARYGKRTTTPQITLSIVDRDRIRDLIANH